jgi:hypothetical protein
MEITQKFLKKHFGYDPEGYLIFKEPWNDNWTHRPTGCRMIAGYQKGKTRADRYERIVIDSVWILIHHLIWFWHYGYMPEFEEKLVMDHIDGNKLNNRIQNLRWVTQKENNHFNMKRRSGG